MLPLSACIITYNEEESLKNCLEPLIDFVDEIVVIDLGSEDQTVQIARKYTNKIFVHSWVPFADLIKNYAISNTNNNWVLLLDPDERITEELKDDIKDLFNSEDITKFYAYNVPFKEYMWGKIVKYGIWGQSHIRLIDKNYVSWEQTIHGSAKVPEKRIGILNSYIVHYSHLTINKTIEKFNKYTEIEANEIYTRFQPKNKIHVIYLWLRMILESLKQFIAKYIYRKGFLEGSHGMMMAFLRGIYVIITYCKVYEIYYKENLKKK